MHHPCELIGGLEGERTDRGPDKHSLLCFFLPLQRIIFGNSVHNSYSPAIRLNSPAE